MGFREMINRGEKKTLKPVKKQSTLKRDALSKITKVRERLREGEMGGGVGLKQGGVASGTRLANQQ